MRVIKHFGVGAIFLGIALILPEIDSMFIDFTQFSPSRLALIIIGLMFVALYYFLKPAYETRY